MQIGKPQNRVKRKPKVAPTVEAPQAPAPQERISPWTEDGSTKRAIFSFIALLAAVAKCQHDNAPVSSKIRNGMIGPWIENINFMRASVGLPINEEEMMTLARALHVGKIDVVAESYMRSVGKALMGAQKAMKKDVSYSHDDVAILTAIGVYYRNKSDSSWNNIVRQIEKVGIPELTAEFAPPIKDAASFELLKSQLRPLVHTLLSDDTRKKSPAKHAPDSRWRLTFQEKRKFGLKHPKREQYDQYLKLHSELYNLWRQGVTSILRKSGKNSLPIEKVRERLASSGIDVDFLPDGYEGRVGIHENTVKLFTDGGKPIYGMPQAGRSVRMNPDYDTKSDDTNVFEAYDDKNKKGYFYTYDFHDRARTKKFTIIRKALEDIDGSKKKWEAPLLAWSPSSRITPEVILSAQAVMIYETQARIGSEGNKSIVKDESGNESEKNTFGLSTWRVGHVKKIDDTQLNITYSGKKAVRQSHIVRAATSPASRKLIQLVKVLIANKKKGDFIWSTPLITRGRKKYVTASDFRQFLKSIGLPEGFGPHKIRHAKGTKIAREIMAAKKWSPPKGQTNADLIMRDATQFFRENIAEKVANALGHKSTKIEDDGTKTTTALWSTSVKSYIDPQLSQQWFLDHGFRPPKWIPKK